MTSKNSLLNNPFLLKPAGKDYLWGGNRLNDDFCKGIELVPLAETWECSTHADGPSTVGSGPFAGRLLVDVLKEWPEFLGRHANAAGALPILVKFIDAKKDLSVQVHPDDAYAKAREHGQRGKTELWYVLDAAPETRLVYGLNTTIEAETLRKSIERGTLESHLQYVPVHKGDVFYIQAGTIHAVGAGALLAEIQENSNLTYRLYDYGRRDKNGDLRPLHIEKALAVADLHAAPVPRQSIRVLKYRRGYAEELLGRCQYFEIYRVLLNTQRCREMAAYRLSENAFSVLLCVDGCGTAFLQDSSSLSFFQGDCIFIPAGTEMFRLHGKAELLDVRC